jgi:hypothetical protein
LFLISGIADYLPVFSWVLGVNSLIINTIHFSGLKAISGVFCGGVCLFRCLGKLTAGTMIGGLSGYREIDYDLMMPQKVRQFRPKQL